jgi:hypothetical protein
MSEALSGIRLLKFFNWEQNFFQKISDARSSELEQQKKSATMRYIIIQFNFFFFFFLTNNTLVTRAFVMFIFTSTTLWVASASFAAYSLSGNILQAQVAFTSLGTCQYLPPPHSLFINASLQHYLTHCACRWGSFPWW